MGAGELLVEKRLVNFASVVDFIEGLDLLELLEAKLGEELDGGKVAFLDFGNESVLGVVFKAKAHHEPNGFASVALLPEILIADHNVNFSLVGF